MARLNLRQLAENLFWLITSVILALFVWIAATIEQNPVESRTFPQRIPIEIVLDEGMLYTNNPITTAQLTLRTQAAVWDNLRAGDISVRADLSGLQPGTYTIDVEVEVASTQRVVVEEWQPHQITVTIDQAAEMLVTVNPDIRSSPPTGFETADISFDPPEVVVSGPAAEVARVARADVRLFLADERNAFTRDVRPIIVDEAGRILSGLTIAPDTVSATVGIQPREDYAEVFVTPNIVGEPANGYVVFGITYHPQTVLVAGRPSELEQLPGTIRTAPIDLTNVTQSFTRTVALELPAGVFLPVDQSVTVSVVIDTLTANRRFERLPVQVQGLSADYHATITPNEVTLLITGPQPILDTLTAAEITVVADLTGLPPGTYQVPLQPVINREGLSTAVISVLPDALDVQISIGTPTPTDTPPGGIIIPGAPPTPQD
ncbi:MAG: hypothetical protein JW910_21825 [Anaerolineae bacterium]|nr:hypothetical protein [Anaerolineae bacterium]